MNKLLTAIALTAATASTAFAQPRLKYYNMVPSTRSPAIASDPSPRGFSGGDYVGRDPDPGIQSELLRDPPADR